MSFRTLWDHDLLFVFCFSTLFSPSGLQRRYELEKGLNFEVEAAVANATAERRRLRVACVLQVAFGLFGGVQKCFF